MKTLVSYAQNFEDIMLWRALSHINEGCYIDVGAHDPNIDSVSKLFHSQGWKGIHIEPIKTLHNRLIASRPGDIVYNTALSDFEGSIQFYNIKDSGVSTGIIDHIEKIIQTGTDVKITEVPCTTLDNVISSVSHETIHWLKIDAEGMEEKILKGWSNSNKKPWIVLIESTIPQTRLPSYEKWEPLILDKGYQFAYFDGLNRFYVRSDKPELLPAFKSPPCVFDDFSLAGGGTSPFTRLMDEAVTTLASERDKHSATIEQLVARINQLDQIVNSLVQELGESQSLQARWRTELNQAQQKLHAATASKHLYRAYKTFINGPKIKVPRKHYANLNVPWHTHLYRMFLCFVHRSEKPWHTHLYRTLKSCKGDPKYTPIVKETYSAEIIIRSYGVSIEMLLKKLERTTKNNIEPKQRLRKELLALQKECSMAVTAYKDKRNTKRAKAALAFIIVKAPTTLREIGLEIHFLTKEHADA